MQNALRTFAGSTFAHVGFAFLAMGGWALFANSGHGLAAAWLPALSQGVLSGLITLVLKRALEAMSPRFAGALAYVVPPAITAGAVLALLACVHKLIGTPEIVRTIAVPWSVSTFYAIVYAATLARGQAKAPR
jgi:LytS/YehU family sensor histidine kinase